jgi:hypothetical protein
MALSVSKTPILSQKVIAFIAMEMVKFNFLLFLTNKLKGECSNGACVC